MPTDRFVISHSGKKGGPWESSHELIGSSTDFLRDAARATKGGWASVLGAIRALHPSAKVFRLVRKAKAVTYPALQTAHDVLGFQRGLAAQIAFGAVMGRGPESELDAVLSATARAIAATPDGTLTLERAVVEAACAAESKREACRSCGITIEELARAQAINALLAARGALCNACR